MSNVGTSTATGTEWMVERLRSLRPTSILDVGCGWGRWGLLAREFLELWNHRYQPDEWRVWIEGIDAHAGTWSPIHEYVYDRTLTIDVRDFEPDMVYDVVVASDVIEHLPRADAETILSRLLVWAPNVLVGIPLGHGWLRGGEGDNPYEAHLSEWMEGDFDRFRVVSRLIGTTEDGPSYAYGRFHLAR